jgi:hypothetical protein
LVFDRSYLPSATLEFVVLTDTHYMLEVGDRPLEFESRRKQTARVEYAMQRIAGLRPSFAVHLGDIVQEYPETEAHARALALAKEQLGRSGVPLFHVAGNQDIGDKPDPTMPTRPVTRESLANYEGLYGPSWYSFGAGAIPEDTEADRANRGNGATGPHFVVLNSSIFNSTLPATARQAQWVEQDLESFRAAFPEQPVFLFMHHPPYICQATEPALGHYDNLAEPARAWLLHLVRKFHVALLFCGHTHFAFFDRIGETRYHVGVSTSFTRPGFGEAFSSAPAPERGRDDKEKLGFYLVRLHDGGPRVHFIRTGGEMATPGQHLTARRREQLLTRLPLDLPHSPVGVTLRHPLAQATQVPLAWPSTIRQEMRNDYPLLALLELGVRHVRVPLTDLADPLQAQRLQVLHKEGVGITATHLWAPGATLPTLETAIRPDVLELQIARASLAEALPAQVTAWLSHISDEVPVSLALVLPTEVIAGKQLPRTRIGFRPDELMALDQMLDRAGVGVHRAACRILPNEAPWETLLAFLALPRLARIDGVDWLVDLPETNAGNSDAHLARAAEAVFAATLTPGCRVFLEPLVDLDRTMDAYDGLLDRRCNPRPALHAVRCLNTVLFAERERFHRIDTAGDVEADTGTRVLGLGSDRRTLHLILPRQAEQVKLRLAAAVPAAGQAQVRYLSLAEGLIGG